MKKITKTFLFIAMMFVYSNLSYSQDMITKKTGEDISAKVLEVTSSEVKYKKTDNLEGPIFSILKSEVLIIRYKNGSKDVFNETTVSDKKNEDDMLSKGKADAKSFYKGKNSGAAWTAVTTILASPVIGVLPAALCASEDPNDDNLKYPNPSLMKNADYNKGYTDEAHKIKNKKVWKTFGITSGVWLLLLLIL